MATVRFRFDGQAINETDTPLSLDMDEGDTIEVYQQQTGGLMHICSDCFITCS